MMYCVQMATMSLPLDDGPQFTFILLTLDPMIVSDRSSHARVVVTLTTLLHYDALVML